MRFDTDFVCSTIALVCGLEKSSIQLNTDLSQIGIDSLTLVSVVNQVEALCSVEFTTDELLEVLSASTVAELIERIERILTHKGIEL